MDRRPFLVLIVILFIERPPDVALTIILTFKTEKGRNIARPLTNPEVDPIKLFFFPTSVIYKVTNIQTYIHMHALHLACTACAQTHYILTRLQNP